MMLVPVVSVKKMAALAAVTLATTCLWAQQDAPKLTEVWKPVPPVVTPGKTAHDAPSDAIVLFDGTNLNAWESDKGGAAAWTLGGGAMTVSPGKGGIKSKQNFGSCQLHIEWKSPEVVKGEGQGRGNSGIFFMGQYELQVLDSYNNTTYSNGQAGSLYKQHMPMANACRKPGEWQVYDVIFNAPEFYEDGRIKSAATFTVFHNGVLIHHNAALLGQTAFIGLPKYEKHATELPLMLQDHGDLVSFRNIWVRRL